MLKNFLVAIALAVIIAAIFIALGGANENPMLGFGLTLSLAAGLVTIGLAISSKLTAMRVQFEPTEMQEQKQSYLFNNIHQIMGEDPRQSEISRLVQDLSSSVNHLKDNVTSLEFDRDVMKNHLRICFDNIRYHEEITLPQALAASWGGTVLSTIAGVIGAVIAAFPDEAFLLARVANTSLLSYICS